MSDAVRTGTTDVSIIVVTHGARDMTLECLESVVARDCDFRGEVIVVDNASPGGLAHEIASLHPDIRLLPQVANIGFAAAANVGAEAARGHYLLFLNPDTLTDRDTVSRLVEFARSHPGVGLCGASTRFANGQPNPVSCRRKATLWRLLCSGLGLDTRFPHSPILSGMGYATLPDTDAFAVDVVCGVCLLVERSAWDRLGGFSPAFFMYGEDDDFSGRARRIGCSPTLLRDVAIVHHGSGTEPDQARKICQLLAARSLIVRAFLVAPARPVARALLLLRPLLGNFLGPSQTRPVWQSVWSKRRQWLSGRFV